MEYMLRFTDGMMSGEQEQIPCEQPTYIEVGKGSHHGMYRTMVTQRDKRLYIQKDTKRRSEEYGLFRPI